MFRSQNESIMKQVSLIILSCLLLLPAGMKAEDDMPKQWTLRNCIDYALEHNITIRRNRINVESTQEDVKTAKADFLPSLSGNISQRIVNRPNSASGTIISGDNITTSESKTSYNGSYGIDANWTVYNGSKRVNTLKQQQLNSRIAELTVDESENSIEENITQLYVQILYSAEAVKVNESTLEVSRKEFERGQELFNAGSIASSDLAQLEAQVSNDNYQLVTSQTTLQNYKLQLKQLLELDIMEEMNPAVPGVKEENVLKALPSKDEVYATALKVMPQIRRGELGIEAAKLEEKSARAGFFPSISLSASVGTGHMSNNDFESGSQIWNRFNENVGLTLNIPIFSNRKNRTAVNKAKIALNDSYLEWTSLQKELLRNVESAYLDAVSAQAQYLSAREKEKYARESYELTSEQFRVGVKNTVELITAQNEYSAAQQQVLQAKYLTLLSIELLNIYQGLPASDIY